VKRNKYMVLVRMPEETARRWKDNIKKDLR
jgi:hypothetical protein